MKEQKINIGNSQKEKIITRELKINKNVFIYNETVIPLCNISRISVAGAVKEPYQLIHLIMIFVGLVFLFTKSIVPLLIGMVLIGLGGWLLYRTYQANQNLGEFLVLNLNSGKDIYLYSTDHDFTVEIMDVIINCMNLGKEYIVNMANCKIEACQFGDENIMHEGRK